MVATFHHQIRILLVDFCRMPTDSLHFYTALVPLQQFVTIQLDELSLASLRGRYIELQLGWGKDTMRVSVAVRRAYFTYLTIALPSK